MGLLSVPVGALLTSVMSLPCPNPTPLARSDLTLPTVLVWFRVARDVTTALHLRAGRSRTSPDRWTDVPTTAHAVTFSFSSLSSSLTIGAMPLFLAYCPDRIGPDVLETRLRVRSEHFQGFKQTVQEGHAGKLRSRNTRTPLSFMRQLSLLVNGGTHTAPIYLSR